ncbi:MAG: hypothetical protein FJ100_01020 [Deltaproteobacteria bacterium]|nr:hypothetical protein [Deltaproteobacteria bacterium]
MKATLALCATLAALAACGTSSGTTGGGGTPTNDATATDGAAGTSADAAGSGDGSSTTDTAAAGDTKAGDGAAATGDTATTGDIAVASDTGGPVGKPVPLEQLEAELLKAFCHTFVTCEGADIAFSSVPACIAFLGAQFDKEMDGPLALIAEVKAGKITYDPVAAGNCIAYIASSCDAFKSGKTPAPCKQTFVGKLADGDSCTRDEVCKSGRCQKGATQSSLCPGKCAPIAKAGGACNGDNDCEGDLLCIEDKCAPKGGKVGASCSSQSCEPGLYCNYAGPAGATCAELSKEGGACLGSEACVKGLYCKNTGSQGACTKPSAVGSPCNFEGGSGGGSGSGGGAGECGVGAVCLPKPGAPPGGQGMCVAKAKVGQPCQGPGQCHGIDTWCPPEGDGKGTCKLLPGKGGTCQPADPMKGLIFTCQVPLSCDPASKVCGDPPGEGKPCLAFCAAGLDCNSGKCMAKAKLGESCDNADCDKGLDCTDGKCAKPVCGN